MGGKQVIGTEGSFMRLGENKILWWVGSMALSSHIMSKIIPISAYPRT